MATTTLLDIPTRTTVSATADCTTAVPGEYGSVPPGSCNSYYAYDPSFGGNLAFAVLFGIVTFIHVIEAIIFKKKYCWVIIMGALWECAGFAIKTVGTRDQQELAYVIVGTLLFLLAPLWINTFVYMTIARLIYMTIPEKKIWKFRAMRLTVLFVWLEITCFLVQAIGGSMLSGEDKNAVRIGQKIYMAGIGLQLGLIVVFSGIAIVYYHRLLQLRGSNLGKLKYIIWTLFLVLGLIAMRIIFRLIEFGPGVSVDNPILSNEAYPLTLDALPMLLALIVLNVMHPAFVLRGDDSEFPKLSRKEKKAIKQQKKEEKQRRKEAKKAKKQGNYELDNRFMDETLYPSSDTSRRGLMV